MEKKLFGLTTVGCFAELEDHMYRLEAFLARRPGEGRRPIPAEAWERARLLMGSLSPWEGLFDASVTPHKNGWVRIKFCRSDDEMQVDVSGEGACVSFLDGKGYDGTILEARESCLEFCS
jgi:hypothetical protein